MDTGYFEFPTLLFLIGEKTKELEKKSMRNEKYGLRPRSSLKCPTKWTGFDSFTYAKNKNV